MLPRVNLVRGNSADYLLFLRAMPFRQLFTKECGWAEPLITISRRFTTGATKTSSLILEPIWEPTRFPLHRFAEAWRNRLCL